MLLLLWPACWIPGHWSNFLIVYWCGGGCGGHLLFAQYWRDQEKAKVWEFSLVWYRPRIRCSCLHLFCHSSACGYHIHHRLSAAHPWRENERPILVAAMDILHLPEYGHGLCWRNSYPHQFTWICTKHYCWLYCALYFHHMDLLHMCCFQFLPSPTGWGLLVNPSLKPHPWWNHNQQENHSHALQDLSKSRQVSERVFTTYLFLQNVVSAIFQTKGISPKLPHAFMIYSPMNIASIMYHILCKKSHINASDFIVCFCASFIFYIYIYIYLPSHRPFYKEIE